MSPSQTHAFLAAALVVAGCTQGDIGSGPDEVGEGELGGAVDEGGGSAPSADVGGGNPAGGSSATSGGNGAGGGGTAPAVIDCSHQGSGIDYQVGPGKAFENIGDVPFESLLAGDTVRIFWRAAHYHEKLMIGGVGTADQPIRVCGVAGPNGELPVIDGDGATTRPSLQFPFDGHQSRGLVVIGHEHDAPYDEQPAHILLESLEIINASPENPYIDKYGQTQTYFDSAAGVFVQRADDVTVRGCVVHDNNNGLFIGTSGDTELTQRVLIEGNYIHSNGSLTDYYHHNVYNEASGVIYQFNRFGEPRAGAGGEVLGANIKERSAGVTIRYNWIEDGAHLIDLVDAQEAASSTLPMPTFHESFIYGNVLLRTGTHKGSMVHYGGDSGIFEHYRKGTLFFYENTVIVNNEGGADYDRPAVFQISTNDETLVAANNIFYSPVAPGALSPIVLLGVHDGSTDGVASFVGNWVTTGWSPFDPFPGSNIVAEVSGLGGSIFGASPGFLGADVGDFRLAPKAAALGAGVDLAAVMPSAAPVTFEYVLHQTGKPRAPEAPPTIGAMTADISK